MDRIYKISFQIYRAILILITPLFLVAKFMVGAAGHNSDIGNSDYLLYGFSILTAILLSILKETERNKIIVRNSIRFTVIALVFISVLFLFKGLSDAWQVYYSGNDPIYVILVIAFLIAVSTILLVGLLKDKIYN